MSMMIKKDKIMVRKDIMANCEMGVSVAIIKLNT